MKRIGLAFTLALALTLPAYAMQKISTDTTPGVSFANYSTFTFVNPTPPAGMDPVAFERIRMGVESALTSKGYTKADPGDISLIITLGAKDKTDINTWGRFGRQVDVYQYTEDSLSVDAFDTKTKQPLWHGQATESVSSKPDPAKVEKAVNKLMAQFPAK